MDSPSKLQDVDLERTIGYETEIFNQESEIEPRAQSVVVQPSHSGIEEQIPLNPETGDDGHEQNTEEDRDDEQNKETTRPKRIPKPSAKVILNRFQSDTRKLDNIWGKTVAAITKLHETPDSVELLRSAIGEVRSTFNEYQVVLLCLMDFAANSETPECQRECRAVELTAINHKEFVVSAISDANERRNSLLQEVQTTRSGSCSSSLSSTAARANVRAKAAAALKKAEMQKRRSQIETQSAFLIEQEELALVRRREGEERKRKEEELALARIKREQEARMESLRLDEEATVALTRAKVMDEELGFRYNIEVPSESECLDLPFIEPRERVREYVYSELPSSYSINNKAQSPLAHSQPIVTPGRPPQSLNPAAPSFSPSPNKATPASNSDQKVMESYIQFMARRELIANKIEKFNDQPENYHTWKAAFKNMVGNVNISYSEELSLMAEYTTNESKKLVQRLRNAYIENPAEGVKEVWRKLGERFGSNAVITQVHLNKLKVFPKIGYKENKKLQDLGDLLLELQCAKRDGGLKGLKILDEPAYLKPILTKLPEDIQGRWQRYAYRFKIQYSVDYPPFSEFAKFIQEIARERNDPYLATESSDREIPRQSKPAFKPTRTPNVRQGVTVAKTEVSNSVPSNFEKQSPATGDPSKWCVVHGKPHPLRKCRAFRAKPFNDRKSLIAQHGICFRCVASSTHFAKDCNVDIKCSECQSDRHVTALHDRPPRHSDMRPQDGGQHGEEQGKKEPQSTEPSNVTTSCTEVCGNLTGAKSCSKICLANIYVDGHPEDKIRAYIAIDDQSNYSLAKSKLFSKFKLESVATFFTLKTCSGVRQAMGRRAQGLIIESLDGNRRHRLPTLTECDGIPDNRDEIPTSAVARAHLHLESIADKIPELDPDAEILLLIGRDVPPLHKVHESRNGPRNAPWAQLLDLGWVVLGNACLDGAHKPDGISAYKTQVLHNGRPSLLVPCPNRFHVKYDKEPDASESQSCSQKKGTFIDGRFDDGLGNDVFVRTQNDNKQGSSVEDRNFMNIMKHGMVKDKAGSWVAPLPFRHEVLQLPNNRDDALKRLKSTRRTLERKPLMKEHYFTFMQRVFDNDHAEQVPHKDLASRDVCWYLPHFGVYHPQKPGKIRVVFDSAAENGGVSLNKLLLSGPDLTNSLLGVLIRFRQDPVTFVADIEQMFHSFIVREDHRDFLRFLWYKDNDPEGEIMEYRMKVHIFGNTSSPAVATYGLRKTAEVEEANFGTDARNFVERNFYVDDGLKAVPEPAEAVDLLRRTQAMLATANLRLHKIASSHPEVTQAFPSEDQASDLRDLDLSQETMPVQRSLGVLWDLGSDTLTFRVSLGDKPFTRRGVLSVTNSLYDPLGLAAPVVIKGKLLLRSMTSQLSNSQPEDWDKPLPEEYRPSWKAWCQSLIALEDLKVPRSYSKVSLKAAAHRELHTFCDASEKAIGAVSYLRTTQPDGQVQVSFVIGKAKLTPIHVTTIPRLELCAAVLGVELTESIIEEIEVQPHSVTYYSDSKVVLGYITNESRRFYVYVSNRVERIRNSSSPSQWHYVPTHLNPADLATRSVEACDIKDSAWHTGPKFLYSSSQLDDTPIGSLASEARTGDPEVRPEVTALATKIQPSNNLGSNRFSKFSKWEKLTRAIARLIMVARSYSTDHTPEEPGIVCTTSVLDRAKALIIKTVQYEAFGEDIDRLKNTERLPKTSPLIKLGPTIDSDGLLRIGGRLGQADITNEEQHPLILPSSHHVTTLLVNYFHGKVQHQGRTFTLGMIRSSGFWIIGGKRLINSVIDKCIKCKKLRGKRQLQIMADLPVERLTPAPPFSYVGLDVFGPWQISARRTRGGLAHSKRWAVLFTCMTTRAIHIEVIESMDTSSFINALRRFLALRGPVIKLRSDCGTNFVGARNELKGVLTQTDVGAIQTYLLKEGCEWTFNPPHASHAGGVWERMIGVSRRILDSMLAEIAPNRLTHEVLTTLLAEVAAIVNARPLVPVSSDPTTPEVLTPATLLTLKPRSLKAPPGDFTPSDLYSKQWRCVQYLANIFWSRWRKEYLPTLQPRRKWHHETRNLREGDLVLLCSKEVARNDWPLAKITKAYESPDGKVRKVELVTSNDGSKRTYLRPVTEVILLHAVEG